MCCDASDRGPLFDACPVVSADDARLRDVTLLPHPVLVRGTAAAWPASTTWSFERLSRLRSADGAHITASFYNGGPAEQGVTRTPLTLPVGPYMAGLAALEAQGGAEASLKAAGSPDSGFPLDWDLLRSWGPPSAPYLAQWSVLDLFPRLASELRLAELWPRRTAQGGRSGWRRRFPHVFIGPARTVTGLHFDWNANHYVQLRGVKEWILFPPSENRHMSITTKFDWGATCSGVNIANVAGAPAGVRASFGRARGLYARLGPGDSLFVPAGYWHSVVAMSPSVSISVFGMTLLEQVTRGLFINFLWLLHACGLYRRGWCTCH